MIISSLQKHGSTLSSLREGLYSKARNIHGSPGKRRLIIIQRRGGICAISVIPRLANRIGLGWRFIGGNDSPASTAIDIYGNAMLLHEHSQFAEANKPSCSLWFSSLMPTGSREADAVTFNLINQIYCRNNLLLSLTINSYQHFLPISLLLQNQNLCCVVRQTCHKLCFRKPKLTPILCKLH